MQCHPARASSRAGQELGTRGQGQGTAPGSHGGSHGGSPGRAHWPALRAHRRPPCPAPLHEECQGRLGQPLAALSWCPLFAEGAWGLTASLRPSNQPPLQWGLSAWPHAVPSGRFAWFLSSKVSFFHLVLFLGHSVLGTPALPSFLSSLTCCLFLCLHSPLCSLPNVLSSSSQDSPTLWPGLVCRLTPPRRPPGDSCPTLWPLPILWMCSIVHHLTDGSGECVCRVEATGAS